MLQTEKNTERLAGILLLLCAGFDLSQSLTDAILDSLERVSVIFFFCYGLSASLFGVALSTAFRKHDPMLAPLAGFSFSAHGLFMILMAVFVLAGLRFPQEFAFIGAGDPVASTAIEATMDGVGMSAYIFHGLGLFLLSALILGSGAAARWIGWITCVTGVAVFLFGGLALLGILSDSIMPVLFPFVMLMKLAFMLSLGISLVTRGLAAKP